MMKRYFKSAALLSSTLTCCTLLTSNLYAQCESWEAYPQGAEKAKEQHVLYKDLFKGDKFEEAFPYWETVFKYVKSPKEAPRTHFSDGIKIYQERMKKEADATKKGEMLKAMVDLYEQMAKCVGENATDRAYQGYYMYFFQADYKATLKILERAMELGKNDVHNTVFVPVATIAVYLFRSKDSDITVEYLLKLYDTLKAITEHHSKNATKDAEKYKEKWTKVEEIFKPIGGQLWGCDFFVNQWKPAFDKDPSNFDQNAKIIEALAPKCPDANEFYAKVLAAYKPEKERRDSVDYWDVKYLALSKFQKAEAQAKEAKRAEKAGRTEEAEKRAAIADDLYEQVVREGDATLTDEEQGTLAYRVAYKEYKKGNYSEARELCRKASKYRPSWGEPYMLVGYMYAGSGKRCDPSGSGTGWDAQVVVWAAMDEWAKAKSVDPSVSDEANGLIAKYRKYCPTNGDGFQRGISNGASYKIGCWIGVTTTVRLVDSN